MGAPMSSIEQKIDWLVRHPDVWRGWPAANHTDAQIIDLMRADGLISYHANNNDIMDFGRLIAEARSRLRHKR